MAPKALTGTCINTGIMIKTKFLVNHTAEAEEGQAFNDRLVVPLQPALYKAASCPA